jgi:V/A-type H+/Na+-transporting ATPase subunit F
MATFYCIADEDTVRGFRLAGVAGQAVESPAQAAAALNDAAARADVGIVIMTLGVAAWIREQVDQLRMEHEQLLVLEIPWPEAPQARRKSLLEFMQEAVGIRIGSEAPT